MRCPWIDRRTLRAPLTSCVIGLLGLVACGDDEVPAGNDSSSEGGSSTGTTTTMTTSSTGVDESSSSAGASTDTSESGSTTGDVVAGPDVRIVYKPDTIANAHPLDMIDVIDGSPTEPLTVIETMGAGAYDRVGDHWLSVAAMSEAAITVVDLASASPPMTWPLELPAAATHARLVTSNADGSLWVVSSDDGSTADLHVHPLAEDGPGAPFHVDGELAPATSSGEIALVQGGQRVAFRTAEDGGGAAIWLGPASADAPPLESLVETPDVALFGPNVDATGTKLIYRTGGLAVSTLEAWFVDLDSDPIADAQPIALLPEKQSFGSLRLSPDGTGVAGTQEDVDGVVDLAWVGFDDGLPTVPVLLSEGALAGNTPFTPAWSPDGRWLAFSSEFPRQLYVIPFSGGAPGEAIAVSEPGVPTEVVPEFSADSSQAYFVAEDGGVSTVMRVALDGDMPGETQAVSAGLERFQQFVIAQSGDMLCYVGAEVFADLLGAWCVDVSGDEPATPVRIDEGLDAELEEEVVTLLVSADDNYVLYAVATDDGLRKVLLDRTSGLSTSLVDGEPSGFALLFGLR